jgi:hypothetical protein
VLGVDAAALRDEVERPLVPADQVKGLLRAACVTLERATDGAVVNAVEIDALFGSRSPDRKDDGSEQDRPLRGALIFGDLVAEKSSTCGTITRVHIDPVTGAAHTGHLQTVDLVAPLGRKVVFRGRVIARIDPAKLPGAGTDPAAWAAGLLDKAIRVIPAVGALKSAGFGQVVSAGASLSKDGALDLVPPQPREAEDTHRSYRVTFDRRLLVDAERVADNVWQGSDIIPGAVFKGALAERLRLAGGNPEADGDVFGRALAAIRVSHAFPACYHPNRPMELPLPLPLSLFVDGASDRVSIAADALLDGKPGLAPRRHGRIPVFQADWKEDDHQKVRTLLGLAKPDAPAKLPRGHVKIGRDYVAEEGNLYIDVARSHLVNGNSETPWNWYLDIHQGGAEAGIFGGFLEILKEGLDGIGATGAHATFHLTPRSRPPATVSEVQPGSGLWAVTLATPAMILDPWELQGYPPKKTLFDAYADYWNETAGAKLENFYASQRLTGGYIAMRRRLYGKYYYPFLLTEPGSVFLLRGDLRHGLTRLLASGLPAKALYDPYHKQKAVPPEWKTCPYLPENGYGEILVNGIDHAKYAQGVSHD